MGTWLGEPMDIEADHFPASFALGQLPFPLSAHYKPKPSRYKLSSTNNLNVCAAFASAIIRALTLTRARHVTTLLTGASQRHIVLAEPVKHRMTVVSGALPAAWLRGIRHEPITLQRAHSSGSR